MNLNRSIAALLGAAALAAPAVAAAHGPEHEHGAKKNAKAQTKAQRKAAGPKVTYVFRGTWNAAAGGMTVKGGNSHVKRAKLVGKTIELDITRARIKVADLNGDGVKSATDIGDGDVLLVQARLPKRIPGNPPYAVRLLVDKTPAPTADDDGLSGSEVENEVEQD
jgi:hypothetical protein